MNTTPIDSPRADTTPDPRTPPRVGLFVTCLVDLFRPRIAIAASRLMEQGGCEVIAPPEQTCCGQPAWNAGHTSLARAVARRVIDAFADLDYVVAPSGSCAAMLRVHYPELFPAGDAYADKARALAEKTHELTAFLVDVLGMESTNAQFPAKAAYHDSCSGLRELRVREQPRQLLAGVRELELVPLQGAEVCCGFGGMFCVKYPDISNKMVTDKATDIAESGADTLLAGDLGCLLNMAGKLKRQGAPVRVLHVAEVLADMATDTAAIGDADATPAKEESP